MKKIIILISLIVINLFNINLTNAITLENKLYKSIAISKFQIGKDYKDGKSYNTKIINLFIKMRYFKEIEKLQNLKNTLKEKIIELNSKKILTINERKKLNLYNNLYYRTILLLDYQL